MRVKLLGPNHCAATADDAAYATFEVEIFNRAICETPGDEVLALMCARYLQHV